MALRERERLAVRLRVRDVLRLRVRVAVALRDEVGGAAGGGTYAHASPDVTSRPPAPPT